jgi:hypothetical protein
VVHERDTSGFTMSAVIPNFSPAQIVAEALRTELLIRALIKDVRTAIPVKVVAMHAGAGTPPAIGTVDVQPLVQTVDGSGKLWSMAKVYGASFCRIESGASAVVVDPAVGDVGLAVVCDRDISSVIASAGLTGPGSARTHDISDLVYVLSLRSSATITQYLLMNANGITMLSPNTITIQGEQINLVGPVNQTNGDVTMATKVTVPTVAATTDVTVPNGSVNSHVHVDPQGGSVGPMIG